MIIALTGGIASGKSTVAQTLAKLGAYVIDADKLGHHAYLAGSAAFDQVVATFGENVVGTDGEIDRRALGGKVFGNPEALKQLTDIVWPAIRAMAEQAIKQAQAEQPERHVVLEAAVLIEAGWHDLGDAVWVVTAPPEVAIAWASARDGIEPAAVQARIDSQISNEERLTYADQVFENTGALDQLIEQVESRWQALDS